MASEPRSSATLTRRPVPSTLLRMAGPMLGGTFAMNAFNLADTWFVAQLGTLPLAAMGFSFPVIMLLISFSFGLGMGATTVVSQALGAGREEAARRLTTHTLILAMIVVTVVSTVGLFTIDPVFRLLGAGDAVMPLIREYMVVWYLGVVFMILPMIGNSIIRSTGDTIRPGMIMAGSSVLNILLDPIFIFGFAGIPAMGIRGAALATLLSRGVTLIFVLHVLTRRHHLFAWERPRRREMLHSWVEVLRIGLPSTFSAILMPISGAVITWLVAQHGPAAVAACGAAGRLEMFAFMFPMALGISLVPFIGQNFGAGRLDRVRQGQRFSNRFAFFFGTVMAVVFFVYAGPLARLFSDEPAVVEALVLYLRIIPIGYGMMEIHRYSGFILNGIRKPIHSFGLNALRVLVFLLPLSVIGNRMFGLAGIFWARAITDVVSGFVGILWSGGVLAWIARARESEDEGDGEAERAGEGGEEELRISGRDR